MNMAERLRSNSNRRSLSTRSVEKQAGKYCHWESFPLLLEHLFEKKMAEGSKASFSIYVMIYREGVLQGKKNLEFRESSISVNGEQLTPHDKGCV